MTVLAVDDEAATLAELTTLLRAHDTVATVLTASGAGEAMRILQARRDPTPDAVFMDVALPGVDGVELARAFAGMTPTPSVVFVTAHEGRAVDAFEVGAVDYLLKPVRPDRLEDSLWRVLARRERAAARRSINAITDEIVPVELAGTMTLVPRSEVRYVEAQGDYARLHTAVAAHLVRIPLTVLEERWREAGWVRTHRSYLVPVAQVTALEAGGPGHVVRLGRGQTATELPVSRRHLADVRARLRAV